MIKGSFMCINQEEELGKLLLISGKLSSRGSIVFMQILQSCYRLHMFSSSKKRRLLSLGLVQTWILMMKPNSWLET